jgi:hypothetical protein
LCREYRGKKQQRKEKKQRKKQEVFKPLRIKEFAEKENFSLILYS